MMPNFIAYYPYTINIAWQHPRPEGWSKDISRPVTGRYLFRISDWIPAKLIVVFMIFLVLLGK
jgi:hypothetical protein